MSTPDSFLLAWWLLTVALCVSVFLLATWQRTANQTAAVWIAVKGGWPNRNAPPMPAVGLPRMMGIGAYVLFLGLLAGFIALIWMADWTRLLLLNVQLFTVLLGAAFLCVGLSPIARAMATSHPSLPPRWALRPLMILCGLLAFTFGLYWVIGDLAFPKLTVEGRIDSLSHSYSGFMRDEFSIVIDGKRYDTLRDVLRDVSSAVKTGDHVRAEAGAASKTILRAEPIRAQ